jgi:hypothetical protein
MLSDIVLGPIAIQPETRFIAKVCNRSLLDMSSL